MHLDGTGSTDVDGDALSFDWLLVSVPDGSPAVVDDSTATSIDWIHPCDIRSIDVIKDGMAAMYGVRGANGVILIETKRGN